MYQWLSLQDKDFTTSDFGEGIAVMFALSGQGSPFNYTFEYSSEVSPLALFSTFGLFAHPPFHVWKGGQITPLDISFRIAAGGSKYSTFAKPEINTGKDLRTLCEQIVRFALPRGKNYYTQMVTMQILTAFESSASRNDGKLILIGGDGYVTNVRYDFNGPLGPDGYPTVVDGSLTFTYADNKTISAQVGEGYKRAAEVGVVQALKEGVQSWSKNDWSFSTVMEKLSLTRQSFSFDHLPSATKGTSKP